ncbi:leukotriene A4 hydrolase [Mycena leptocephala]|nr:leukotriene A4 hydrolase [Mycena leptocephala]
MDPTTHSNYLQIASDSITFDWIIDFPHQFLSGCAKHRLNVLVDDVSEVMQVYRRPREGIFDTSDLEILRAEHEVMGSALHIPLPAGLKSGTAISVAVFYKTTKDCTALQWLEKEQTQGKSFPYLFSQCQPIYARAMAPLQAIYTIELTIQQTYTATVTSVLPVLLSAIRVSPPSEGPAHDGKTIGKDSVTYSYTQPVPIPSYLIAIASGNVRYKPFPKFEDKKWRTGIWAEPELLDAAYWEFSADTARFLAAEEKIVTPYKFGVYDLLVLPPSFPYGGMENACLFCMTRPARGFSYVIGAKSLTDALKQYSNNPRFQRLVIEYDIGEDPDDAYSEIPYEKGSNLILHLERTLGGLETFLPYVKDYVSTFIGKSITTEQWKSHLYAYYERNGGPEKLKALDSIDWNAWFYGEGLELPVEMEYDLTLAQAAYALAARWDASRSVAETPALEFKKSDLDTFSSTQIVVFLERLQDFPAMPETHIKHLGTVYGISSTANAEIRLRFYNLALSPPTSAAAEHFAPEALKWVVGGDGSGVIKGRMKFCRPIFRGVFQVNEALAKEAWEKNQSGFHPIARKLIEKDLGLV